LPSDFLGCREK
jgi:hypothetical protein